MMITYENIFLACWATFLIVWVALAFNVKRDVYPLTQKTFGVSSREDKTHSEKQVSENATRVGVRRVRGGFGSMWRRYWPLRLVALVIILFIVSRTTETAHHDVGVGSIFVHSIFPQSLFLGWIGAVLSVVGVGFAIWARLHLGRNWSPRPAVKEHHELVTSGPYVYVRHPIYTGVILMAFGIALTGSIWGIGVFIAASLVFIFRIGKEERIMLELFPDEYPAYQKRTKRLVPFVW